MPIPSRFTSAFSQSTLRQLDAAKSRIEVRSPLFFRAVYTAVVVENARRTFAPIVAVEASRIARWWCRCSEELRLGDLCRHLAFVLKNAAAEDGSLIGERYEASLWRAIGFESFLEGRTLDASSTDPRDELLRKWALTAQEQALVRRGAGSTRLQWEASPWYPW